MEKVLDDVDRKIIQVIVNDARTPLREIADICHISRAAVHQHLLRMQKSGVLMGSTFIVNPKSLGYQLCAYVGITLEKGNMYKEVSTELEKIPEVVESQFTLGAYSMLIKLYARDDEHLLELLNTKIQEIPGVAKTETLTALDQRIKRSIPVYFLNK